MDFRGRTMSEFSAASASEDPLKVTIEDVKPVVACRGCLVTAQPLRLLDDKLADAYSLLISNMQDFDINPKYICMYCRALLRKFMSFREKCLFAQSTLTNIHSMGIPITSELLKSCFTISSYPLKLTDTLLISIEDVKSPQLSQHFRESCAPDSIVQNLLKNESNDSQIKEEDKTEVKVLPGDEIICLTDDDDENQSESVTNFDYHQAQDVFDETVNIQHSDYAHDNNHDSKPSHEIRDSVETAKCIAPKKNDKINKKVGKRLTRKRLKKRADYEKKFDVKIVDISKEQQIQQMIERKYTHQYKNAEYKCELCYNGFITKVTYENHMARHKPVEGHVICDICKRYYPTRSVLSRHIKQFHTYDYICNTCGHVSKASSFAKIHNRWHKGVLYDCKICGKTFSKPNSVHSHIILTHRGSMPCPICNNLFIGKIGLNQHMKTMHKEAIGAVCASCGVQFHSVSAMQRHRPQGDCDHTHRPCTACGMGFTSDLLLLKHKSRCENKKEYTCEICSVYFDSKKGYLCHIRNRHYLYRHKRDVRVTPQKSTTPPDGADPVSHKKMCEICGKWFDQKHFDLHRRRQHTGETLFNCDHCAKGYHTKLQLQSHMYQHMGKPVTHSCKYCHKTFTHYSNRRRHEQLVHEGLRPFTCEICGYKFKAKGDMQRHVQHTHAGVPWPKRDRNHTRNRTRHLNKTPK